MSRMTFEGRATKINFLADHTYMHPASGGNFKCWGGDDGPDNRLIVTGQGIYDVANCYRCPIGSLPDTACIGVYAVNGVCHQSCNCFLYSAGVTLTTSVRGYWASVLTYGVYGTNYLLWLIAEYNRCHKKFSLAAEAEEALAADVGKEDTLFSAVRMVHEDIGDTKVSPSDLVIKEAAAMALHAVPDLDAKKYEDLHTDLLKEVKAVIDSGLKGEQLADKINVQSVQFQKAMAERLGPNDYEKLFGMPAGETINIVDPEIAKAVAEGNADMIK